MKPKIYVASRASVPERAAMWRKLRSEGHNIISTWIDEPREGRTTDWSELWHRIQVEVHSCDYLLFYAEPSDLPLKGAFVEVGMALGMGRHVVVVAPGFSHPQHYGNSIGSWVAHERVILAEILTTGLALGERLFTPKPEPQEDLDERRRRTFSLMNPGGSNYWR